MYKFSLLICLLAITFHFLSAQDSIPTDSSPELPVVSYSLNNSRKYTIADIKVTGMEGFGYDDYILIGISGLTVGQKLPVPGNELTAAVKAFWKHGLFSDATIYAERMTTDSVWLNIALKPNSVISAINYNGVKKSEREDLESKIGVAKGSQLTPNLINRARKRIKDYFDEKGFSNAEVTIQQYDDVANQGKTILNITINKNEKTKVREIIITGNNRVNKFDLRMAMKKTNSGFSLKKDAWLNIRKIFSTKKFVREEYENDLQNIIAKYNEQGFRDAEIISDSVAMVDDRHVSVYINVKEGDKYYIRDIKWVGNTQYPSNRLELILNMKPGDVYNQKKLGDRLQSDEDAVSNLYYNSGYIFAQLNPVETYVENDSVDLEVRVIEGRQATINKVIINGNDRIYEDVIRRELLTKPGQLFSKELLMQSAREIAQSGHFDPENMDINPLPNPETGTVDLQYGLTPKANDEIEFSAGWGPTGLTGRMSFKFQNFSFRNLLYPSTYKGIIPQGDGQTLTLSGQTNGKYYQSYSISFMDPWFGKKRPNSLSLSAYYMVTTGVDDRYYQQLYNNPYYYSSYGSYGGYNDYGGIAYDESKSMKIIGLSAGYGKRLSWPDYLFNFMADVSYQRYMLRNWTNYGFPITNGNSNSFSMGLTLSRSSIDNPLYTRKGSQFSASLNLTPPYSLITGKVDENKLYEWIEFHKWKFKSKIFIPLANPETVKRTPVLMSRIEYGFIGSYDSRKRTPFETFYMGGDGMTGNSSMLAIETIGLRGYGNGLISATGRGYAYSRVAMELRYPILLEPTSTIYALAFVEVGNAWTHIRSFNPFDLKRSAGVGARIFLPMIGLMGIDWGYGFDAPYQGAGISGGQLHFILGQEF